MLQQLRRLGDAKSHKELLGGHSQGILEQSIQIAAINANIISDIRHFNRIAIIALDKLHRLIDIGIRPIALVFFLCRTSLRNNGEKKGKLPCPAQLIGNSVCIMFHHILYRPIQFLGPQGRKYRALCRKPDRFHIFLRLRSAEPYPHICPRLLFIRLVKSEFFRHD